MARRQDVERILGKYRSTDLWEQRKQEYLAGLSSNLCEVCEGNTLTRVEHLRLNQNRLNGDDEDWDIIALCDSCGLRFSGSQTRRRRTARLFGGADAIPEHKQRHGGGRAVRWKRYLASSAWKERRKQFLSSHPICEGCQTERNLHVHHANYASYDKYGPGGELDRDLCTLCKSCHMALHEMQREQKLTVLQATQKFLTEIS